MEEWRNICIFSSSGGDFIRGAGEGGDLVGPLVFLYLECVKRVSSNEETTSDCRYNQGLHDELTASGYAGGAGSNEGYDDGSVLVVGCSG